MSDKWQTHNKNVISKLTRGYVDNVIKPESSVILQGIAQDIVNIIENDSKSPIPIYTANLHDATGVGVYVDSVLVAFIPTKRATKKQHSGFDGNVYNIDGNDRLQNALAEGVTTFSRGVWIVLFSAVPYAYYINLYGSPLGRGTLYFEHLKGDLVEDVLKGFKKVIK